MNLLTKVLLTLLLVITLGMLTVSLLVQRSATNAYQGYLGESINRRLAQLATDAGSLYAQTKSWQQVQNWLDQSSASYLMGNQGMGNSAGRGAGQRGRGGNATPSTDSQAVHAGAVVLLVNPATGQPLADPAADRLNAGQVALGAPINAGGVEIARLVDTRSTQSAIYAAIGPAEQAFLDRINQALAISSLVAGVVALVLGGLLVYSVLKPLRSLEEGVFQVAKGNLDTQVHIHSRDEIGQLAQGFNRMASNLHRQEALRQRLVADIAHELRTPLSVIQGNLQAMLDGIYPLTKEEITTVHQETRVLSRLIQDLHELAQAEAGNLPLSLQTLDAGDVITHMANVFRPLAEAAHVHINARIPASPIIFVADPDRVQQILHNLMGNALRHTLPQGTITLSSQLMKKKSDGLAWGTDGYTKTMRFSVRDSGKGIDPADLPHVFDRFYRGDPSRSQKTNHTTSSGLGLAIVKALVEAQGGEVGVAAASGGGTVFWFDLPVSN